MSELTLMQKGDCVVYRPAERVEAGTIVKLGDNLIGVVGHVVEANELGAVDLTGFYHIPKDSGVAFAQGAPVYVKDGKAVASGGDLFGYAIHAASETVGTVDAILVCFAPAIQAASTETAPDEAPSET